MEQTRFPHIHDPLLVFDGEPIHTRLPFRSATQSYKEDLPMSKEDFVAYLIQHTDEFPENEPITLESAQLLLDNTFEATHPDGITAQDVMDIWNRLIEDPSIMEPDEPILN